MGVQASRVRSIAALLAVGLAACAAEPPFQLTVTFVGEVELEVGAEVRYQGVPVGEVDGIALRQSEPNRPAKVEIALSIDDPAVTLRASDVFEVASDGLIGENFVRVTPGPEPSRPLEPGETVAGLPPFVTRVKESMAEALDSLGTLAQDQSDALLEALAELGVDDEAPPETEGPPEP